MRALWPLLSTSLWALLGFVPLESATGMPLIERVFLFGAFVIVPLGLTLMSRHSAFIALSHLVVASCAALATLMSPGTFAAVLVAPYVVFASALAVTRALSILPKLRALTVKEFLQAVALGELVVAALWLLLSRLGGEQMGFDASIVGLTAVHFHFAGFASAVIAGALDDVINGGARKLYKPAAIVIGTGPAWVGLGIALSPLVEVISAAFLVAGVLVIGGLMVTHAARPAFRGGRVIAGLLLSVSALCLIGTMALAFLYASGEFLGVHFISIPEMVLTHGVGNAFGFATLGVLGFLFAKA